MNLLLLKLGLEVVRARFQAQTLRQGSCLLWKGSQAPLGYGRFSLQGYKQAHRVAYFLHNLYWPKCFVCHACDTKLCVEPSHLKDASHAFNMKEMASRKRARVRTPLREGEVLRLRFLRSQGVDRCTLANLFNIRIDTVTRVVHNRRHGYGRRK